MSFIFASLGADDLEEAMRPVDARYERVCEHCRIVVPTPSPCTNCDDRGIPYAEAILVRPAPGTWLDAAQIWLS